MRHNASTYGNHGCRCALCTASHRLYQRGIRRRRWAARVLVDGRPVAPLAAELHGKESTYNNHGCRCDPCTDAARAGRQRRLGAR